MAERALIALMPAYSRSLSNMTPLTPTTFVVGDVASDAAAAVVDMNDITAADETTSTAEPVKSQLKKKVTLFLYE